MGQYWPKAAGPNFVPAYQISGVPFVFTTLSLAASNGTPLEIKFPAVTRWIMISAKDAAANAVRIGFSVNGVKANPSAAKYYYLLQLQEDGKTGSRFTASTGRMEIRTKSLFLIANETNTIDEVSIVAGLTQIDEFPVLTGSNGFTGVG
tara:strand:+ start:8887 stop:9333 length:447 start_codon:yes stop_codon:yes gene_type:complete